MKEMNVYEMALDQLKHKYIHNCFVLMRRLNKFDSVEGLSDDLAKKIIEDQKEQDILIGEIMGRKFGVRE